MNHLTHSLLLVAAVCTTVLNCQPAFAQSEPQLPSPQADSFQIESINLQPARLANYEVGEQENEFGKVSRCEQRDSCDSIFSYLPFVGRLFGGSFELEFCPCESPALSAQATWETPATNQSEPQLQVTLQQPRAAALRALLTKRAVHNRELRTISDFEQCPNTGCAGVAAGLNVTTSDNSCRCTHGEPCEAELQTPGVGAVILAGTRLRLATGGADCCCAEAKTCAASACKCKGECKCCNESRGENCECSNCSCGKNANSECKCEGNCSCGTESRGTNCVCSNCSCGKNAGSECKCEGNCSCGSDSRGKNCGCDNCRCANGANLSNQLLDLGQNIDSPEALSAFITKVVKQHGNDPSKQQLVDALVALATENFKLHVQMMVHGNEHRSAEAVNELRQELMGAHLENVRMQAKLEASETLLKMAHQFHGNPRNNMPQPVFSPQVIHLPPQIDTWQAPVRLATPQSLPVYPQPVNRPVHANPSQTPQVILPPSASYVPENLLPRPDTNIQPSLPHPSASNSPQLQDRIQQLEREIVRMREARTETANCLPRPIYPPTRVDPVQFSIPAVDGQRSDNSPTMWVTPRIIMQEEEEVLVAPAIGR